MTHPLAIARLITLRPATLRDSCHRVCGWLIWLSGLIGLLSCAPIAMALDAVLDSELRQLDAMRSGRSTPAAKVEARGKELLEKYSEPEELGLIHYQLAHIHAQSGQRHPDLVILHCEKGLDFPLEPAKRLQLYIYCGDAFQAMTVDGVRSERIPFSSIRKKATEVYLKGLRDSEAFSIPIRKPEIPSRTSIQMPVGDAESPEFQRKLAELQKENEEFTTKLQQGRSAAEAWENRRILYDQIVYLYLREPVADDELRETATKELPDHMVTTLFDRLKEKAGERQVPATETTAVKESVGPPPPRSINLWLWGLNIFVVLVVIAGLFVVKYARK